MLSRRIALAMIAFATLAACASTPEPDAQTIYLVRHAEKASGQDPHLTIVGRARSEILAAELADANLSAIYSTDTNRTRETAAPTANAYGLTVLPYDASNLDTFANMLRATPGNILVVGHSNTTPALVKALGGKPGTPIVEATEYDRLYVLTANGRRYRTELRRYGN